MQIDNNFMIQTFRMYNLIISPMVRNVPYRPTDDEVVHSKRLGSNVVVDLHRSNPLIVFRGALSGQKFKRVGSLFRHN